MAHGGGYVSDRLWRDLKGVRDRDRKAHYAEIMQSPPSRFKLSRGIRPDERFDSLLELARRLHRLRRGRAIVCTTGFNARGCKPNGPCVSVRLESDELIGHAFLTDPGSADRERLEAAIRATEPKPDFLAQLGEDAEAA